MTAGSAVQATTAAAGQPWYGWTPSKWDAAPLKRSIRILGGGTPSKDDESFWVGDVPWASPKDIKVPVVVDTEDHISARALIESATQLVPANAVLVVFRSGILRHTLPSALSGCELALNQDLKAFVCGERLDPRFLKYLLMGLGQRLLTLWRKQGATVESLDLPIVVRTVLPQPPISEQRVIADYLDRETARIDALIAKKHRLAALESIRFQLARRRLVAGTSADGAVRPVGLTWTNQMAAHWALRRLRQVARLESGHTPSRQHPEYWVECHLPWVSLADVASFRDEQVDEIHDTAEAVSEMGIANSSARLLPAGTVILSRTASVGFACILGRPMATTQDFANWVCGAELRPKYLLYVLRAMTPEFEKLRHGSTHQTIYMPDIKSLMVPLPSLSEQDAIIQAVDNEASEHRQFQNLLARQTALLQERRQALITAAVTGQIHVAEAA